MNLKRAANMAAAKPGEWWEAEGTGEYGGKFWINLICPKCRRGMSIHRGGEGHRVDAAGNVTPSVVCPHAPCDWHVFVKLEGIRGTR